MTTATLPTPNRRAGPVAVVVGLSALTLLSLGCGDEPDPDQTDNNRRLIAAAWDNDVELARTLIADGADVNHQDQTRQSAYLIATSEGHSELLQLTLDSGADVTTLDGFNGTGLIRAAERGHTDIVERLLQTEIDVNHVNNLGWTALHEAIILGDGSDRYIRTVSLLLEGGADPTLATADDQTPLALAESHGQPEVAGLIRTALGNDP